MRSGFAPLLLSLLPALVALAAPAHAEPPARAGSSTRPDKSASSESSADADEEAAAPAHAGKEAPAPAHAGKEAPGPARAGKEAAAPAHAGKEAPADAAQEVDAELPPSSTRWKIVLGGVGFTAAWYGAAVGMSFAYPDAPGAHDLRVPIVGPWMAIAHNCGPGENCSGDALSIVRAILTAIDGIGQAAGPVLALESILIPTGSGAGAERRPPGVAPAPEVHPKAPAQPSEDNKNLFFVRPVPVGLNGVGLTLSGAF